MQWAASTIFSRRKLETLSRIGEAQIETHATDVDDNEVWGKIFLAKESGIRFGGDF
ncbi:MAG TPA: hypothetical protein VGW99_02710 [Chthoniobacterales bacterium]|nr:hypothetical protein [Chthoniobacterales bacterium]